MKKFINQTFISNEDMDEFNKAFFKAACVHSDFGTAKKALPSVILRHLAHSLDLNIQRFLGSFGDYPVSIVKYDLMQHLHDAATKAPMLKDISNIDMVVKYFKELPNEVSVADLKLITIATEDILDAFDKIKARNNDSIYLKYSTLAYTSTDIDEWFGDYSEVIAKHFTKVYGYSVSNPRTFLSKLRFNEFFGE